MHWSIKQNYQGAATETHALLKEFCEKITATTGHSKNAVLLVSGGGAKRAYNTVSALSQIVSENESAACRSAVHWHVAYNPHIPQVMYHTPDLLAVGFDEADDVHWHTQAGCMVTCR